MRSKKLSQIVFILIRWGRKSFSESSRIVGRGLVRCLKVAVEYLEGIRRIVGMGYGKVRLRKERRGREF